MEPDVVAHACEAPGSEGRLRSRRPAFITQRVQVHPGPQETRSQRHKTKQNPTKLNQTKMSLRGQFSIKEEYIIPTLNSKSCLTEHQTELMIQKEKKITPDKLPWILKPFQNTIVVPLKGSSSSDG